MRKFSVWRDEGEVDQHLIVKFANSLGVVFPETYISLISKYDYLYPEENIFDFTDYYGVKEERDIVFFGYKQGFLDGASIHSYSKVDDDYSYGKDIVAFGGSANGDYVCFDYRKGRENPSVVVMYHDDFYEDENGDTKMVVNYVADNFDDFLEMLHEPPD
ncbi:SMI1/KNR4 family protein [Neisseria dentiae]|uniref:SMI1/KNR4 family protein n=1 Tax=Neisseria dentiae TaxID=194197 RepID=UPI00211B93D5|nr:SMI1/KNR4 family protein [Neisseria dentiae]MCQ9327736.1 SMI1/KNR4 family protein [Neisseria dentiae]